MPRIAGVNLVAVLVAAVVVYFVGFLWYGLLFSSMWMAGHGYTEAMFEGNSPLWMAAGFIIPVVLCFGLAWHMKQKGITRTDTAIMYGVWLSLLIGVPLMAYNFVYSPGHSLDVFLIDASHTVVSIIAACAVIALIDRN